jgi:hypothetical protein
MKITDVKVTLWGWKDIPLTRYTLNVASTKSRSTQMANCEYFEVLLPDHAQNTAWCGTLKSMARAWSMPRQRRVSAPRSIWN